MTTPMNLTLPLVSQTPGPEWASTLNSNLSLIDTHNHTPGFGALVPTAGLDIDDDLDLNGFGLVGVNALTLNVPSVSPSNASVYADSVGDMYWKNSAGNPVQITSGSSVAGASGTITGLVSPASAVYYPGIETFKFESDTNKPAVVDHGPLYLRLNATGSYGIQIQPALGISANWSLTLPAADPGATRILGIVSGGQVGYVSTNSTLTLTGSSLTVANSGITATQIASGAVGTTQLAANAVTLDKTYPKSVPYSIDVALVSTSSTTPTPATGLSCSIVAQANKPICVELLPASSGTSYILSVAAFGTVDIASTPPSGPASVVGSFRAQAGTVLPVTAVRQIIIAPSAGTYQFQVEFSVSSGGGTISIFNAKLVAYAL